MKTALDIYHDLSKQNNAKQSPERNKIVIRGYCNLREAMYNELMDGQCSLVDFIVDKKEVRIFSIVALYEVHRRILGTGEFVSAERLSDGMPMHYVNADVRKKNKDNVWSSAFATFAFDATNDVFIVAKSVGSLAMQKLISKFETAREELIKLEKEFDGVDAKIQTARGTVGTLEQEIARLERDKGRLEREVAEYGETAKKNRDTIADRNSLITAKSTAEKDLEGVLDNYDKLKAQYDILAESQENHEMLLDEKNKQLEVKNATIQRLELSYEGLKSDLLKAQTDIGEDAKIVSEVLGFCLEAIQIVSGELELDDLDTHKIRICLKSFLRSCERMLNAFDTYQPQKGEMWISSEHELSNAPPNGADTNDLCISDTIEIGYRYKGKVIKKAIVSVYVDL